MLKEGKCALQIHVLHTINVFHRTLLKNPAKSSLKDHKMCETTYTPKSKRLHLCYFVAYSSHLEKKIQTVIWIIVHQKINKKYHISVFICSYLQCFHQ